MRTFCYTTLSYCQNSLQPQFLTSFTFTFPIHCKSPGSPVKSSSIKPQPSSTVSQSSNTAKSPVFGSSSSQAYVNQPAKAKSSKPTLQLSSSFHSDTSPLSVQGSDQRLSLSTHSRQCAKTAISLTVLCSKTAKVSNGNTRYVVLFHRGQGGGGSLLQLQQCLRIHPEGRKEPKSFPFSGSISYIVFFLQGTFFYPLCISKLRTCLTEIVGVNIHSGNSSIFFFLFSFSQ